MVFEYKVLLVEQAWSAEAGREIIENKLNELGKDGWELVPVDLGSYLILKRVKPSAKG